MEAFIGRKTDKDDLDEVCLSMNAQSAHAAIKRNLRILELRIQGNSIAEIAKQFGVSPQGISGIVRKQLARLASLEASTFQRVVALEKVLAAEQAYGISLLSELKGARHQQTQLERQLKLRDEGVAKRDKEILRLQQQLAESKLITEAWKARAKQRAEPSPYKSPVSAKYSRSS